MQPLHLRSEGRDQKFKVILGTQPVQGQPGIQDAQSQKKKKKKGAGDGDQALRTLK